MIGEANYGSVKMYVNISTIALVCIVSLTCWQVCL